MPRNPPIAKSSRTPRAKVNNKHDIIYSTQWKKISKAYREYYPVCQRCEYIGTISHRSTIHLSVHHIRGRIKYPLLAFDYDNLLTLCAPCHRIYTTLEREGNHAQSQIEGEMVRDATLKKFW